MKGLKEYRDKVAVVTGASSGIGAELARELARRGMRVALVARRRDRLEQLAEDIQTSGGQAAVHVCDVSSRAAVEKACADVVAAWGGIDLLVNSAGYGRHVLLKDHDIEDIERITQVNYLGTVYWIKAALPHMRARGSGWIVNVSSFAGVTPQPDEAAYAASKWAVTGLSESIAPELEPLGIHVLVVHPVLVRTEMFTPDVLARLPGSSEGTFIEAPEFVRDLLRALERGKTSVVIPGRYAVAPILCKLFPRLIGGAMSRVKLRGLPDLTS